MLSSSITVSVGVWLLDLNIRGPLWQVVVLVLALALLRIAPGLFLSAFARNEFQVVQFMPLAILPHVFFAGLLVPVEQMPDMLQWLANDLPLRYALEALNEVSLAGTSWFDDSVRTDTLVTLIVSFVVLAFGWFTLQRTTNDQPVDDQGKRLMPMPQIMAKTNRFWINPLVRLIAGKIGPFALLIHHGRTSGKKYRTPLMAFTTRDGFVIALTYGRGTDWEQNVLHEGGCELIFHRHQYTLTNPRFVMRAEANAYLPTPVRQVLPIMRVHDFLRLHERP